MGVQIHFQFSQMVLSMTGFDVVSAYGAAVLSSPIAVSKLAMFAASFDERALAMSAVDLVSSATEASAVELSAALSGTDLEATSLTFLTRVSTSPEFLIEVAAATASS